MALGGAAGLARERRQQTRVDGENEDGEVLQYPSKGAEAVLGASSRGGGSFMDSQANAFDRTAATTAPRNQSLKNWHQQGQPYRWGTVRTASGKWLQP